MLCEEATEYMTVLNNDWLTNCSFGSSSGVPHIAPILLGSRVRDCFSRSVEHILSLFHSRTSSHCRDSRRQRGQQKIPDARPFGARTNGDASLCSNFKVFPGCPYVGCPHVPCPFQVSFPEPPATFLFSASSSILIHFLWTRCCCDTWETD